MRCTERVGIIDRGFTVGVHSCDIVIELSASDHAPGFRVDDFDRCAVLLFPLDRIARYFARAWRDLGPGFTPGRRWYVDGDPKQTLLVHRDPCDILSRRIVRTAKIRSLLV